MDSLANNYNADADVEDASCLYNITFNVDMNCYDGAFSTVHWVNNWTGWGDRPRQRIAKQLWRIRHWTIIEGDYTEAPDVEATWFIDPPYDNDAGRRYGQQPDSFAALGEWCRTRKGSVIVCEQEGADWLPFKPLGDIKSNAGASKEVVYLQRSVAQA